MDIKQKFHQGDDSMIKIGYQGLPGSNSEEAAHMFVKRIKLDLKNVEFVPLINSQPVINALKRNDIDYAVVAVKNTLGGLVTETFDAIKDQHLGLVDTEILHIHHCLFKKQGSDSKRINTIASHVQALKQTKNNREKYYPGCEAKEVADTAIAAKHLSEGILPDNVAVLCRKNAGEMYGLELMQENLEDDSHNFTEFRIFKN